MNFLNAGRHSPAFLGETATEGIDEEAGKATREKETEAEGDESIPQRSFLKQLKNNSPPISSTSPSASIPKVLTELEWV